MNKVAENQNKQDHTSLLIISALLDQGILIFSLSLGLLVCILGGVGDTASDQQKLIALTAIMVMLVQSYYAIRTRLDAALFRQLAHQAQTNSLDLVVFDTSLAQTGLVKAGQNQRPGLEKRISGGKKLLLKQIMSAALLAALTSLFLFWG